eukprot:Hpha_TRINITY_DN936_c0_g1::TRINITY_DN936_c0_g1_i1::g.156182::m.156182
MSEPTLNSFGYDEKAYDKALRELLEKVQPLLPTPEARRTIPSCAYGIYSDEWVARFLRARASPPEKFHVNKSLEMITASIEWRKEHRADYVLRDGPKPHHGIYKAHPMGHAGHTKDGCGLFVERLGRTHLNHAVPGYVSPDDLVAYKVYSQEDLCREIWQTPRKLAVVIVDTDGLGMSHGTSHMIKFMQMQGKVDADNYPEVLSKVFVINTARVVMVLWGLVKAAFDPKVREKIQFCGADYSAKLLEHIDASELPDFLNGGERAPRPGEDDYFGDLEHLRLTPSHPAQEGFQERVDSKQPQEFTVSVAAQESVEWRFLMEGKHWVEFEIVGHLKDGTDVPIKEREAVHCEANHPYKGTLTAPEGCIAVNFSWYPHGKSWFPGHHWMRYFVQTEKERGEEKTVPQIPHGGPLAASDGLAREPTDPCGPELVTALEWDDDDTAVATPSHARRRQSSPPVQNGAPHAAHHRPSRQSQPPPSKCGCCTIS